MKVKKKNYSIKKLKVLDPNKKFKDSLFQIKVDPFINVYMWNEMKYNTTKTGEVSKTWICNKRISSEFIGIQKNSCRLRV